tara:strand:+ start:747 stop:1517 length:771 start_codon:yes stop_codon:yes gene_type:complete
MLNQIIDAITIARKNKSLIPDLNELMPKSVTEAYAVQEEVVDSFGLNPIGWKVGCTTKMAQKFSGMTEPFFGVMFSQTTFDTPMKELSLYINKPIIEPELCFEIIGDMKNIGDKYNINNVIKHIKSVFPVIEIVDARYQKGWDIKALETISDNGVHCCLVKGKPLENWQNYDRLNSEVNLYIDDELMCGGRGKNVLEDPLNSISWLANKLIERGKYIQSGEIITTGNTCDKPIFVEKNKFIRAVFDNLGEVGMSFS